MAKRRMKRVIPKMNKTRREFEQLMERNVNIDYTEFLIFKSMINRANRKGARMRKSGSSISTPKYTYNIKVILNDNYFKNYMRSLARVLNRNYNKNENLKWRENFKENMRAQLETEEEFEDFEEEFDELDDNEVVEFFSKNKELNNFIYGKYKEERVPLANMLNINGASLKARIQHIKKKK